MAPQARFAELERELSAAQDPLQKAMLHYELGHLAEFGFGQAGPAVQHYLAAYNLDREFRLALYALLRLFEQRGTHPNLPRLYTAQEKGPRTTTERAASLIDQALAGRLAGRDDAASRDAIDRALAEDPSSLEAALLRACLWPEDPRASEGALAALSCRAHHTDDPERQALALIELSEVLVEKGDVEAARTAALKAVRLAPSLEATHLAAETLLRREGPPGQLIDCLTRHARQLQSWLGEQAEELPEAEHDTLAAEAAALWCEAARLGVGPLATPGDTLGCLKEATRLLPDDPWIHQLRMFAHDLLEDRKAAATEAETLLSRGVSGRHAAGLHFRRAELSLTEGEFDQAREQLAQAMECSGGSRAAAAMLDDLLFDEKLHTERLQQLRDAAEQEPEAALEGALVAAHELGDAESARTLFQRAANHPPLRETALREAYWAAVALGDAPGLRTAIDALLEADLPAAERAALFHHRLEDEGRPLVEDAEKLAKAMQEPDCAPWLPTLVRLRAAQGGDWPALALAHLALAAHDDNPEERAAHLCAAARAQLRAGQAEAAERSLRGALELDPAQPYPLTLLQEALRGSGHEHEVVELLVQTAEQQKSSADAEMSLLLAGAAAEAAGDHARAIQAYHEAAERSPKSLGPLWALWRLAEHSGDASLGLGTREALAEREQGEGAADRDTLALAREYESRDEPALAEAELRRVLENPACAAYAAIDLTLLKGVSSGAATAALDALANVDAEGRARWLRARELWQPSEDTGSRQRAVDAALQADPHDRWALWAALSLRPRAHSPEDAAPLEALADVTEDGVLAEGLRAEALRVRRSCGDEPPPLHDDLARSGVTDDQPMPAALARTLLECTGEGIDPALRARAQQAQLARSEGEDRAAHLRGLSRSRLRAGDATAATELLIGRLEEAPTDLASWELLRVAARAASQPAWVVAACDTLAEQLSGTLWAELSEEAAAVRMDHLNEDAEAEQILRGVLARHPARPIAYQRLHDLLTERDDTAALLTLVSERIGAIDDPEELTQLFYEQARLYRAEGDLERALDALDNLLMLESDHVAGLALAAEVHTAQEDWEGAVRSLRELAQTDIPGAQRKLARLGAADYLEKKLGRPDDALAELVAIETEGLAGPAVHVRMANLHESQGSLDRAVRALEAALADEKPSGRAKLLRRLAELHQRLREPGPARSRYLELLELRPTDLRTARALAELTESTEERQQLLRGFEDAVRQALREAPAEAEPYRKLRASAELRGDRDLALRALHGLSLLGALEPDEAAALQAQGTPARIAAGAALADAELASLLTPRPQPAYQHLGPPVLRAAAELDRLEPSTLGVGRGQRISPRDTHPLRDEIQRMLVAVGGELADFYVGGPDQAQVRAAPKGFATHFVVGSGITAPLSAAQRHAVALQVAASRLGCLPLLTRSGDEGARLLHAALVAAERGLAPSLDATNLQERGRALWKAAARRDRKAIEEAAREVDDGGEGARAHVERTLQHVQRLALLLSGDLEAALTHLLGRRPDPAALAGSERAGDLMAAWLSPELGELRRKLGMAA